MAVFVENTRKIDASGWVRHPEAYWIAILFIDSRSAQLDNMPWRDAKC